MDMKMKLAVLAVMVLPMSSGAVLAGDAAVGEGDFKKCKACHAITAADGTKIVKGGRTGPDLYGVIGRAAGSSEGFKYSASLAQAGEGGLVWDEERLAAFIADPNRFLKEATGAEKAKSKMTFKHKKGAEDMAAYLATQTE